MEKLYFTNHSSDLLSALQHQRSWGGLSGHVFELIQNKDSVNQTAGIRLTIALTELDILK